MQRMDLRARDEPRPSADAAMNMANKEEIARWRLLLEAKRWRVLTSRWPPASDWNLHAHRGELRDLSERCHRRTGPWPAPSHRRS